MRGTSVWLSALLVPFAFCSCETESEQDRSFTVINNASVSIRVSNVENPGTISAGGQRTCSIPEGYSHGTMLVENMANDFNKLNVSVEPGDRVTIFGNEDALGFDIQPR